MTTATLGTGRFVFRPVEDWARLPDDWVPYPVNGVAVDSQDRVYVFQHGPVPITVFDYNGNLLAAWGAGYFKRPHGIYIDPDDYVYLGDRDAHVVMKCTLEGKILLTLGRKDQPGNQVPFNLPSDMFSAPSGDLFVSDGYGNSRVHRFSPSGRLLLSWGSPGDGKGQFNVPHGVWVDREDRVYVCDRENSRIQLFSDEGLFLNMWTGITRPSDIYMDADQFSYVTEQFDSTVNFQGMHGQVSILDPNGKVEARLEGIRAHGLCVDSRGDIYVGQARQKRVVKLVRQ